jgi:UDP-N-acetylmuramate dehydrogenase
MLRFEENVSLKPYNTFGIEVQTKFFYEVKESAALKKILPNIQSIPYRILGGGSNVLFTENFEGLTLLIANKGIQILEENERVVKVEVQAGENWHEFVLWCLDRNFGGVENLSLIPGSVGAAPIQNIGAYGVELSSVFESCKALNVKTLKEEVLHNQQCEFEYRSSIFKTHQKGNYIITSVCFKLQKNPHKTNIEYGSLSTHFKNAQPSIQEIANAVIATREAKLPNPKSMGNGGSFFKNPVISKSHYERLKKTYEDLPSYPVDKDKHKIPAAWLIEFLGFKGKVEGNAGVHKKQALVLVNLGEAKGKEILVLANKIQSKVKEIFHISLETEVNVL